MEQDTMKTHGAFSWNEMMTSDLPAAKVFYGDLFGWTYQDLDNNGMNYTMVKLGDREVGGMMTLPPDAHGMPPAWGPYVTVKNVNTLVSRVEKLGGKICVPPRDIPGVGRFAVIQDPQGATLSLITYSDKKE